MDTSKVPLYRCLLILSNSQVCSDDRPKCDIESALDATGKSIHTFTTKWLQKRYPMQHLLPSEADILKNTLFPTYSWSVGLRRSVSPRLVLVPESKTNLHIQDVLLLVRIFSAPCLRFRWLVGSFLKFP